MKKKNYEKFHSKLFLVYYSMIAVTDMLTRITAFTILRLVDWQSFSKDHENETCSDVVSS